MRYFLHLSYLGTRYRGWQSQPNVSSVQQHIEDKLAVILRKPTKIHPCGRTDAGVHASQFFAHINIEQNIDFDLVYKLNSLIPNDIIIHDLADVPARANAQLDATNRTYRYYFHTQKNPFITKLSSYFTYDLDISKMERASQTIANYHDFESMCLQPHLHNHTNCQIKKINFHRAFCGTRFCFEITADRFLRGMIRLLMGRLVDIGREQLTLDAFVEAIETKKRVKYHTSAPPQGLYLAKVDYPFLSLPISSVFEDF